MARITKEARAKVRQDLLTSAARHFAREGLGGANINRISLDAGYAKGTVYNYFSSKDELFEAVLTVGSDETVARFRARAVEGGVRAQLRALVEEDVALVQAHPAFMKTLVRELVAERPEIRQRIQAALAPLLAEVAALIAQGQAAGELRIDLPADKLALAFLGGLTMAYVQHWATDGAWPTWPAMPELVVTLFWDGAGRAGPLD
jgi:AcrR family transcriptional regulator